jgi:Tol biopolymer transport system component
MAAALAVFASAAGSSSHASCKPGVAGPAYSPSGRWVAYLHYAPSGASPECSWDVSLRVVRSGGSKRRTIVHNPLYWEWAPRGDRIAIVTERSSDAGGEMEQLLLATPGGRRRVLYASEGWPAFHWSPSGTALAVLELRSRGNDLLVGPVESGPLRTIATAVAGAGPAWSPDSRRIAYTSGQEVVHVVTKDGRSDRALATGFNPTWSADGHWISFARKVGEYLWNLHAMRPDGSEEHVLSNRCGYVLWAPSGERAGIAYPCGVGIPEFDLSADVVDPSFGVTVPLGVGSLTWSPTAERLAMVRYWNGDPALLLMDPDGSHRVKLESSWHISWAPDGHLLLVEKEGIYAIHPDGHSERLLAKGTDPAWSPDSRSIVYVRARPCGSAIVGLRLGGGARRLAGCATR